MPRRLVNDAARQPEADLNGRDSHVGGGSLAVAQSASTPGEAGEAVDAPVPDPQHQSERPRHAVTAHRELPHILRDVPDTVAARREKGHFARTEPANFALFVGHEHLAGNDVQRFIDRIMPNEAAGRAGPHND